MIPEWNEDGLLPPVLPGPGAHLPQNRSPYPAAVSELVERFGGSLDRVIILQGFFDYRAALYAAGVTEGFQWVNGSFVEDVERLERRPPNDLDVVTFFYPPNPRPAGFARLFDNAQMKADFLVDAYGVMLGALLHPQRAREISYWHSMWSFRRDGVGRGFLQVALSPNEDAIAVDELNRKAQREDWL